MLFPPAEIRQVDTIKAGSTVLDVGCGDGVFLARAAAVGHKCLGLDRDPKAVAIVRARGIQCREGSLADLLPELESVFDLVTASHVVEHVYEPTLFLGECRRLLKPGGKLWLETPNARAWGRTIYGPDWRGLEVPRHLCIFTVPALMALLQRVGFTNVRLHWSGPVSPYVFAGSVMSRKRRHSGAKNPIEAAELRAEALKHAGLALALDLARGLLAPAAQEFITMTADTPS